MTLRTWDFEVSPAGTTLTGGGGGNVVANDGTHATTAGVNSGAATVKSSSDSFFGGFSAEIYCPASSSAQIRLPFVAGNLQGSAPIFHKVDVLPSGASLNVASIRFASGNAFKLFITSAGKLQLQDTTSTAIDTSTPSYVAAQWNRIECVYTVATSTTGVITVNVYNGNGTTPYITLTSSTANLGTGAITAIDLGTATTVGSGLTAPVTQRFDVVRLNDGGTAELGPLSNVLPTVSVSGTQVVSAGATVNLTATVGDSDGTIASIAWTYDYPLSGGPSITGAATAAASFTAGTAPQLYIVRCTVTDNAGGTAFATTEVRVNAAGSASVRPIAADGTNKIGTWTKVGGSATEGAALADNSDATYLETGALSATEQKNRFRWFPSGPRNAAAIPVRAAVDSGTGTLIVRLYEGSTLRQTWSQAVDDTITDYEFALSGATVSAIEPIHGWETLWVEFGGTS